MCGADLLETSFPVGFKRILTPFTSPSCYWKVNMGLQNDVFTPEKIWRNGGGAGKSLKSSVSKNFLDDLKSSHPPE